MSIERLAELYKLTTPGDWGSTLVYDSRCVLSGPSTLVNDSRCVLPGPAYIAHDMYNIGGNPSDEEVDANAEFIALAHNLMPQLIEAAKHFDPKTQIALIWSIEDVQLVNKRLSDAQAMKVLQEVERKHDCTYGVSWDVVRYWVDELYPDVKHNPDLED